MLILLGHLDLTEDDRKRISTFDNKLSTVVGAIRDTKIDLLALKSENSKLKEDMDVVALARAELLRENSELHACLRNVGTIRQDHEGASNPTEAHMAGA